MSAVLIPPTCSHEAEPVKLPTLDQSFAKKILIETHCPFAKEVHSYAMSLAIFIQNAPLTPPPPSAS